LAYRAGGIAEIIHHESDGLLAPCGNIDQLTTELTRLVGDAGLRQRLGAKGRTRALKEFDWPSKLDIVRRVYEAAIEKKKSRE
jgi:glycosyltransferase involved in cell wall biosynthesis